MSSFLGVLFLLAIAGVFLYVIVSNEESARMARRADDRQAQKAKSDLALAERTLALTEARIIIEKARAQALAPQAASPTVPVVTAQASLQPAANNAALVAQSSSEELLPVGEVTEISGEEFVLPISEDCTCVVTVQRHADRIERVLHFASGQLRDTYGATYLLDEVRSIGNWSDDEILEDTAIVAVAWLRAIERAQADELLAIRERQASFSRRKAS